MIRREASIRSRTVASRVSSTGSPRATSAMSLIVSPVGQRIVIIDLFP